MAARRRAARSSKSSTFLWASAQIGPSSVPFVTILICQIGPSSVPFVTEIGIFFFAPGGRGNAFPTLPHAPQCIPDVRNHYLKITPNCPPAGCSTVGSVTILGALLCAVCRSRVCRGEAREGDMSKQEAQGRAARERSPGRRWSRRGARRRCEAKGQM